MRYATLVVGLVMFAGTLLRAGPAGAQERARAFADVPFDAGPATVLEAMKALQLTPFVASTADQPFPLDQQFEGRLKGQDALVTAVYDATGHLEKMLISFLTPDEDCVSFYRTLKKELQQKYGAPVTDLERWEFPYDKGGHVGQEHFAIRVGKGLLAAVWNDPDAGSTEGGVALSTTDNVIVQLAYESSKWAAEAARRRKILDELSEPSSAISTPGPASNRQTRFASSLFETGLPAR
jgi:hypothetical protein